MTYTKGMFKGKKITVMGLGLLGRGVGDVEFFAEEGAELIVTDLKSSTALRSSLEKLRKYKNIRYTLGKHKLEDFENRDFILKAAGVPLDSPYIFHARKHEIPVYMTTALFASLTPAKVVGITGTRGKTTVTYMVYEILKRYAKGKKWKVYLGGNIRGMATLPLIRKTKKEDLVVLELDSWQLQGFGDLNISPDISAFTTFMPDHLNYYGGDLELYFKDKLNIFLNQKNKKIAFAGEQLCLLPKHFTAMIPKRVKFVSERMLPKNFKLRIPGEHNEYNGALAYAVTRSLKVPVSIIKKGLEDFKGVSGRLEKIKTYKGVDIYNDTTATTPAALVVALRAVGGGRNVILIAGGADKNIDLSDVSEPIASHCKAVLLLDGNGTERMLKERIIPETIPAFLFSELEVAVREAIQISEKGDVILLSPGFASFGMFKNEYDRGDQFTDLIRRFTFTKR